MDEKRQRAIEELKTASPLEITSLLEEMELYDKESSQKVIDEVYEQFASGENMQEEILVPVFSAVVDGLLERTKMGRSARKKGITASRVIQECKEFSYDGDNFNGTTINGYTEYKNANHDEIEYQVDRTKWEKSHTGEAPEYKGNVNSNMSQNYNKETMDSIYLY